MDGRSPAPIDRCTDGRPRHGRMDGRVIACLMPQSVDTASCQFPGCARPRATPPGTGGATRYCDDSEHNARAAYALRQRERATAAASAHGDRRVGPGERPASMAIGTLRETVERMAQLLSEFDSLSTTARSSLAEATDLELVEAQLAAGHADAARIVAEAQGELAAEQQRRTAAEEEARTAVEAVNEMQQELDTAIAEAAEARSRVASAERASTESQAAAAEAGRQCDVAIAERDAAVRAHQAAEHQAIAAASERDDARQEAVLANRRAEMATAAQAAAEQYAREAVAERDRAVAEAARHQDAAKSAAASAAAAAELRDQALVTADAQRQRAEEAVRAREDAEHARQAAETARLDAERHLGDEHLRLEQADDARRTAETARAELLIRVGELERQLATASGALDDEGSKAPPARMPAPRRQPRRPSAQA